MAKGTNLDLILSTDYLSIDDEKILQEEKNNNSDEKRVVVMDI